MRKFLQKKSKKGITLVESVIAVVLLGFAATGILTMLTVSGTKIFQLGSNSAAYADATQVLDMAISAISNAPSDSSDFIDPTNGNLKDDDLKSMLKELLKDNGNEDLRFNKLTITSTKNLYAEPQNGESQGPRHIRGWYLTVTYKGATVTGFASNTEGAFDKQ